ncbi:MAG: lysine biosynthesis protein LysX [Fervidicoccaceae archaeon]
MRVLMVYDVARWEEKDIRKKCSEEGLELSLLALPLEPIELGRRVEADIALQRCVSFNRALSSTLALEASGMRVVNSSSALAAAEDKAWAHSLAARAGIRVPRAFIAYDYRSALRAADALGYPIVVKPLRGSWGRLVHMARDPEELRSIVEHRLLMGEHYKAMYVQEFIAKPGRDIRTFCLGGRVVAGIYRVSDHWVTNTARGGKAVPLTVDPELEDLTVKACEALGVEFGGVDFVEDPARGYMLLEVNGVPEYRNTVRVTGVDVSRELARFLKEKIKR